MKKSQPLSEENISVFNESATGSKQSIEDTLQGLQSNKEKISDGLIQLIEQPFSELPEEFTIPEVRKVSLFQLQQEMKDKKDLANRLKGRKEVVEKEISDK